MSLLLHFAGWSLLLAVAQLLLSDYQRTHWCDLPDWAGPGLFYLDACTPNHPRSEADDGTVTVGFSRDFAPSDTGTQNSVGGVRAWE